MDYVSVSELDGRDYISSTQLNQAIPTPTVLPPCLTERLSQLERDVSQPGGLVDRLATKLQDYMNKEQGSAVAAGPYVFRDAMAADAWLKTLGVSDPLQYCPDWRIQLGMMAESVATESEQLRAMADAGKAGFASLDIAAVHLLFFNPYPETMLKASGDKAHAATDGRTFVAAFATATIYEGDATFIPNKEFERVMEHNWDKFQVGIDMMFPPDQPGQSKTNAVFSHVL